MNKINYPTQNNLKNFLSDYRKIFDTIVMQKELDTFLGSKSKKFKILKKLKVSEILTSDLGYLIDLNKAFASCKPTKEEKESIKKIFNYDSIFKPSCDKYQSKIAKFFVENKDVLKLKTCYFCNLENISAFTDTSDYINDVELLKYGTIEDLVAIRGIGNTTAEKIKGCQNEFRGMLNLEDILEKLKENAVEKKEITRLESIEFSAHKYYFTLDHVLHKGDNPLSSLSLFNLVPSCYACNSKFKTTRVLIKDKNDEFLSPTSDKFSFCKDNTFKIYFSSEVTSVTHIKAIDNFAIRLKPNTKKNEYDRYDQTFKLNARYKEFKGEALDLICKGRRYTPDKLISMSKMLGITVDEVKENVFGKQLNNHNMSELPKSKFLSDIAKQANIK